MFKHSFLTAGVLAVAGALLSAPAAPAAPVHVGVHVGGYYHPAYGYHGTVYSAARPYYDHYYHPRYIYNPWYTPWYYGSFYTNPTYYSNYYTGPTYVPPVTYTPPPYASAGAPPVPYQSYYTYPPGSSVPPALTGPPVRTPTDVTPPHVRPAQEPSTALINVRVPDPNAEILVDGTKTTQRGTARQFASPALTPGPKFQYQIEARWMVDGKEVSQTRKVTIQAGDRINLDFTAPAPSGDGGKPKPGIP